MRRLAAASVLGFAAPLGAQTSTFQGIGDVPGGPSESAARGVSDDGQVVVGHSVGPLGNRVPVRWTAAGRIESFEPEPLGVWDWNAVAASADGSVIVGSSEAALDTRAFRWTEATGAVDLGDLPGGAIWAAATSVSGNGSIVVGISDAGIKLGPPHTAFRWTEAGGMHTFLPGPPSFSYAYDISSDGTTIVGTNVVSAYQWTATGYTSLGVESFASAVSGDGSTAVGRSVNCGAYPGGAVSWGTSGACLTSGMGFQFSAAYAVSADGGTILLSGYAGGTWHAHIWTTAHGTRSLRDVLEGEYGLDLTGWQLGTATSVSANGKVVVGTGTNPCGQPEGWVAFLGTPACPPDCNTDGALSISDFACFQTRFIAQDPYADCNRNCTFTIADFACFQAAFAAGCP